MGFLIGKDVPWKRIKNQYFRIRNYTFLAQVKDGVVNAPPSPMAYALLEVECPVFPEQASMVVAHKLDFQNLWRIYKESRVLDTEEVLVVYRPAAGISRIFAAFLPRLVFLVYPKGHLERLYDQSESDDIVHQSPVVVRYGLKDRL